MQLKAANRYLDIIDSGIDVAIRTREYEDDSSMTMRRLANIHGETYSAEDAARCLQ